VRYRFRVTLDAYGHDEDAAEQFLNGFVTTHPEVGPVVSQDTEVGTMTVTFSIEAASLDEALDLGRPVFIEGASASDLKPPDAISMNASLIEKDQEDAPPKRELQPA